MAPRRPSARGASAPSPREPDPRTVHRYTAFYCEENVWHLAADPRIGEGERFVVFISNARRQCPTWMQRAAPVDAFVAWDYHVVLVVVDEAHGARVWDLDTRLAFPVSLVEWVAKSFPFRLADEHEPRFRVVPAAECLATFASDRSHMRTKQGRWRQPPPPWPPIQTATEQMNLDRFVDVGPGGPGEVLDRDALLARFTAPR